MARQLVFDWPTGVAVGAADFFVSAANTHAYAMLRAPEAWPEAKLVLIGPAGSGKSHLARVFAAQTGARILQADCPDLPVRASGPLVIEDVTALPLAQEEALFHLHNHMRAMGLPLLMTARCAPSRWDIALPDLASRMQATTIAAIDDPDDALLQALIMKLFADRQVMPGADVIAYLAARIERSHAAAAQVVALLDRVALSEKRPISRALAVRLLDKKDGF